MILGDPWFVASDLAKALGYRCRTAAGGAVARMDLDTEDRFIRYKSAMICVMHLVDGQSALSRIDPAEFGCLLHVLHEDLEEAVPAGGGRLPRAVNDLDSG